MPDQPFAIPMQPKENPLSLDDKETLLQVLADHEKQIDVIHRCEDCTIDMTERKSKSMMHKIVARKILQRFFGMMFDDE